MKKTLFLLIVLYGHLYALEQKSTLTLYHQILSSLTHKENVIVYTNDRELLPIFRHSRVLIPVIDPEAADVIIVGNEQAYKKIYARLKRKGKEGTVFFFATSYRLFKAHPPIVGALYWKKGRSQLLFLKPRLERYGITLPKEYQPFIVEEL